QVLAAGRVLEVLTAPTADRAVLRQAVTSTRPSVFRIDYGQLTRSLDGVLRNAELPVVLHLVTDAQATSLPTRFAELAPRTPADIRVHVVGNAQSPNWAVESFGGSAATGELSASVVSYAPEPADTTVRLEPGGRAEVSCPALDLRSGANRVTVSLSPSDRLETDDRRYLVLKRPEPRTVLVVAGDARGRAALFTGAALETLRGLSLTAE